MLANNFRWIAANRRARLLTVVISLVALFFTQSALAVYACPGVAAAIEVAQMTEAGMPCAETMSQSMDNEQPALCHSHCQSSQGASDQAQPVQMADFSHAGPVLTISMPEAPRPRVPGPQPSLLRTSASPPLPIANCCFRT